MLKVLRSHLPIPFGNPFSNSSDAPQTNATRPKPTTFQLGAYADNLEVLETILRNSTAGRLPAVRITIKKEMENLLVSTANVAVISLLTYLAANYATTKTKDNSDESNNDTAGLSRLVSNKDAIFLASTIGPAIHQLSKPINNILHALISSPRGAELQAELMRSAMKDVEKKTEALRDKLPRPLQEGFDKTLGDLREKTDMLQRGSTISFGGTNSYSDIEKLFKRLNLFLSYPSEMKDVFQLGKNGNLELADQIATSQKDLVTSYNNKEVEKALNNIITLARNFSANPDNASMPVAYFYGPPGTGKTHCVKEISKVLQARMVSMKLGPFLATLGEPVRIPGATFKPPKTGGSEIDNIPSPYREIMKSPTRYGNLVVLLDEVSPEELRASEEQLKLALLKPAEEYPDLPGLGMPPLHRPMLVVICNNYDTSGMNPALLTRIHSKIRFPNWTPEGMQARVNEMVEATIKGLQDMHHEPVVEAISTALRNLVPFILETVNDLNKKHPDRISFRDVEKKTELLVSDMMTTKALAYQRAKMQKSAFSTEISQSEMEALQSRISALLTSEAEEFDNLLAGNSGKQPAAATIPVIPGALPQGPIAPHQLRRLSPAIPPATPSVIQQKQSRTAQTQTLHEEFSTPAEPFERYVNILKTIEKKCVADTQRPRTTRRNSLNIGDLDSYKKPPKKSSEA